jgi:hypothetical protein
VGYFQAARRKKHVRQSNRVAFAFGTIAKTSRMISASGVFVAYRYTHASGVLFMSAIAMTLSGTPERAALLPVIRAFFHVWIGPLHPALRPVKFDKSKLFIRARAHLWSPGPSAEILAAADARSSLPSAISTILPAMFRQNKNVSDQAKVA